MSDRQPGRNQSPRDGVNCHRLGAPVSSFSHVASTCALAYLSRKVGQDLANGKVVEGGMVEQTRRILGNVRLLLEDFGLSLAQKVCVFSPSMANFASMKVMYAAQFTAPYAVRPTTAVKELPLTALVEIELIARTK